MSGRNNNKRGGNAKTVKAQGGASQNSNNVRKLSDRFDRIVQAPAANKSGNNSQNQKGKKVVVVQRKGSNPKPAVKGGNGGAKAAQGNKKKDNKTGKNGKAAAKPEKEKPKSAEDLDLEMATYWHKAGKGPDPVQAKLDAEMDSYFAKKADSVAAPVEAVVEASTE